MTAFIMLVLGLAAGAFATYRYFAPKLVLLKKQFQAQCTAAQESEAKWLELISMLDDNGQLPEGAADKILQREEAMSAKAQPELTEQPGSSSDRCSVELARIEAGQPSRDSLRRMSSSDICTVLLARIEAGRPLQHSLEGMSSSDRTTVQVACAEAGIEL